MKRERLLVLLLVLPLVFGLAGCGKDNVDQQNQGWNNSGNSQQGQNGNNNTPNNNTTNNDPGSIPVNKTQDDGIWKVTVHSVSVSDGTAGNKPAEGSVFIVVHVSITNIGKADLNADSMFQAYGKVDDKIPVYNAASTQAAYDLLGLKTLDGLIKPGNVLEGAFAMEAPKDSKVLVFRWTTGFDAELKFTIDLR